MKIIAKLFLFYFPLVALVPGFLVATNAVPLPDLSSGDWDCQEGFTLPGYSNGVCLARFCLGTQVGENDLDSAMSINCFTSWPTPPMAKDWVSWTTDDGVNVWTYPGPLFDPDIWDYLPDEVHSAVRWSYAAMGGIADGGACAGTDILEECSLGGAIACDEVGMSMAAVDKYKVTGITGPSWYCRVRCEDGSQSSHWGWNCDPGLSPHAPFRFCPGAPGGVCCTLGIPNDTCCPTYSTWGCKIYRCAVTGEVCGVGGTSCPNPPGWNPCVATGRFLPRCCPQ